MPHQVHSATHPGMRGPLNLLMGENWLVWHFWNPSQLSYQMAVIELFTNVTFAVRLSPPISAQSRLQSRPNLASNLASQLHIDFGKALLALLRELARAHLISMPPGADARLERHRIEEALITGECF